MTRLARRWKAFLFSTRGRLVLLVLLVAIPALIVQVVGSLSDLRREISERKAQVALVTAHAQGDFENMLDQTSAVFSELVRLNEMRNPENCTQVFNSLRLAYARLAPEAINLGLSDAQGNVYCAVTPALEETNIATQPHFQGAVSTLDISIGPYLLSPMTEAPVLKVAYPVLSFNGQVQTVIFVEYGLQWLTAWQNEIALPANATVTLIGIDAAILERKASGASALIHDNVQAAAWFNTLAGREGVIEGPDLDGVRRLNTLLPLVRDGQTVAYLHLGYPVDELYSRIRQSLAWRLALLALTLLVGQVLAWQGSERLFLHPLRSLMAGVGRVQAGDLQARAPEVGGLTELGILASDFNRMASTLQAREAERTQAQNELQQSQERFRAVFDNAAIGVAVMSLDRRILQVNQAATDLTGYSVAEMLESNPATLAVEEDRDKDRDLLQGLLAGKRDQYTIEKRYRHKDGHIFWGRVNFSAVRGADGKPIYTIGMIEDISEEKLAADKLAAQEAEHRQVLEQRVAERTEELRQANQLLQQKAAQEAVSAERTRLARELHDAVTQTLFSATLIAEVIPELWNMDPAEGMRRLEELQQLTRGALAEMRSLLVELRPNALVEVPLPILMRQLCEAVTGRARIPIQLSIDGQLTLPPDAQVTLYRIAQEALNNVVKHSRATQALINLRLGESVRLTVADNGKGFDPSTITADHLGLKIMRERADVIGARLALYSEPGEGTQITVTWEKETL